MGRRVTVSANITLGESPGRKEVQYVARTKDGDKTRTGKGETEKAALDSLKATVAYEAELLRQRDGYPKVIEVGW